MQWKPIVIGVDSSAATTSAVWSGVRIAKAAGVGYSLVHGTVPLGELPTLVPLTSVEPEELTRHLRVTARRDLQTALQGNVPPEALERIEVHIEYPLDALRRAIEEQRAGLLVLGGKHRTALGRWMAGSLAHRAIRTIDVPTVVTSDSYDNVRRVLAAVDLSAASRPTVDWAIAFAQIFGAELRVLHVVEPLSVLAQLPFKISEEHARRHAESRLDEFLMASFIERPAANLRVGLPVIEIADEARSWGADLIVVGSHGKRWIDRALIGSTTEALLNELPASLVVVPTMLRESERSRQDVMSSSIVAA